MLCVYSLDTYEYRTITKIIKSNSCEEDKMDSK